MIELPDKWIAGLHAWGIRGVMLQVIIIAAILIIAFIMDYVCRRLIIPIIRKVVLKTRIEWDDYLLNDKVLDNTCHLIPPIVIYLLLPVAIPADVYADLYCGGDCSPHQLGDFFLIRVVEPERQTERPPAERRLSDVEDDRDRRGRHHYLQSAVG